LCPVYRRRSASTVPSTIHFGITCSCSTAYASAPTTSTLVTAQLRPALKQPVQRIPGFSRVRTRLGFSLVAWAGAPRVASLRRDEARGRTAGTMSCRTSPPGVSHMIEAPSEVRSSLSPRGAHTIHDRFARLAVLIAVRAPGQVVVERVGGILRKCPDLNLTL
jgi:hypothetical protein